MLKVFYFVLCLECIALVSRRYTILSTAAESLSCTVNYQKRNYWKIDNEVVYDTDSVTKIPKNDGYYQLSNVKNCEISHFNPYVTFNIPNPNYRTINFVLKQVDEAKELSKSISDFCYNFTLRMECINGDRVDMYITVSLIDTNNHGPFFDKPKYTYNLISSYDEDFKRQQILHPIVATDYDITNTALQFSIEENKYFDIIYNGIVPNTLNKKHYALLTPKVPGKLITEKIELKVRVTDMGYPARSNVSLLVINPPSPPIPKFTLPFYVGHYYKNYTFVFDENLELEEGCSHYLTRVEILDQDRQQSRIFYAEINDDKILIKKNRPSLGHFYEENYTAYELKAYYTDPITELFSTGTATFIVEHHHDL